MCIPNGAWSAPSSVQIFRTNQSIATPAKPNIKSYVFHKLIEPINMVLKAVLNNKLHKTWKRLKKRSILLWWEKLDRKTTPEEKQWWRRGREEKGKEKRTGGEAEEKRWGSRGEENLSPRFVLRASPKNFSNASLLRGEGQRREEKRRVEKRREEKRWGREEKPYMVSPSVRSYSVAVHYTTGVDPIKF